MLKRFAERLERLELVSVRPKWINNSINGMVVCVIVTKPFEE